MNILSRLFLSILLFLLINSCVTSSTATPTPTDITQDEPNDSVTISAREISTKEISVKKPSSTSVLNLTEIKGSNMTDQVLWQRVTVQYFPLEGGFYGLITESGSKLLPVNLAKEYRIDGSIVEIKGDTVDLVTIQQWGTPFKITDIRLIKKGKDSNSSL